MSIRFEARQERDGRWRATARDHEIVVEADDLDTCVERLHRSALDALPAVSWKSGPPVLFLEVTPHLVGVTEAARLLGWDRRRVATYVRRGAFPEPVASLAGGRVWALDDVAAFAEAFRERQRRRAAARSPTVD